jgi:hypothetical protein
MRLCIVGKSGSLHQFIKKVKNRQGIVVEYPKVEGMRDPENPLHFEWHWTYKIKIDEKFKTKCVRVHPLKALKVRDMILEHSSVAEIEAFLAE